VSGPSHFYEVVLHNRSPRSHIDRQGYEVTEPPTDRSAGGILEYSDGIAAARTLIAYMRRVYVP